MATKIGAFAYLECSARTKEGVQQVDVDRDDDDCDDDDRDDDAYDDDDGDGDDGDDDDDEDDDDGDDDDDDGDNDDMIRRWLQRSGLLLTLSVLRELKKEFNRLVLIGMMMMMMIVMYKQWWRSLKNMINIE